MRVQTGTKDEQQRLVVGQRHAVRLPRVTLDGRDELVVLLGAGFEPAVALKHLLHDSSRRG